MVWPLWIPARDLDVHILAVRQVQALRRAIGGIRQRHRHFGLRVGADAKILRLEIGLGAAAAAASESLLENVLEAAEATAATAAPAGTGETLRAEIEVFEVRVGTEPGAPARSWPASEAAVEALEARLALGVDLAAIEGFALVLVGEQFIGGIQLGKARRRLWIVLVGVRMQFFRKLAVGAFDIARACLAIDAQDLIGITHPCRTPS